MSPSLVQIQSESVDRQLKASASSFLLCLQNTVFLDPTNCPIINAKNRLSAEMELEVTALGTLSWMSIRITLKLSRFPHLRLQIIPLHSLQVFSLLCWVCMQCLWQHLPSCNEQAHSLCILTDWSLLFCYGRFLKKINYFYKLGIFALNVLLLTLCRIQCIGTYI